VSAVRFCPWPPFNQRHTSIVIAHRVLPGCISSWQAVSSDGFPQRFTLISRGRRPGNGAAPAGYTSESTAITSGLQTAGILSSRNSNSTTIIIVTDFAVRLRLAYPDKHHMFDAIELLIHRAFHDSVIQAIVDHDASSCLCL